MDSLSPIPLTKLPPWAHQLAGWHWLRGRPFGLVGWDMGTGKTKLVYDLINNEPSIQRTLILCPSSIVAVWRAEAVKHLVDERAIVCAPPRAWSVKRRAEAVREARDLARVKGVPLIVVLNYEACWRPPFGPVNKGTNREQVMPFGPGLLFDIPWDLIACDESHRVKDSRTAISKFLTRLGPHAKRRVCLSGTFMSQSPLDVFGQFKFMEPSIFGYSWVKFAHQYAVFNRVIPQKVDGYQRLDELRARIAPHITVVRKRDVLDLPPVSHVEVAVELSAEERRVYGEMKKEFVAWVQGQPVTAANALVKILRLQQIASGYLPVPRTNSGPHGEDFARLGSSKREALAEILGDIEERDPIVVFCKFVDELDQAREAARSVGRSVVELSGRLHEIEARWCPSLVKEGGTVAVVQVRSGGLGIDLTAAAYGVYFSQTHSLADYDQSLARLDRAGQTRPVTFYHLLPVSTVEWAIRRALAARRDVIESILAESRNPVSEEKA